MATDRTDREEPGAPSLRDRAEAFLHARPFDVEATPTRDIQALIHELTVHQTELEIQNEELRQAQAELAFSRDRYSDLYEFAPVGYVTFDRTGHIREANLAATTLLGTERQRLIGASLSSFVAPGSQDDYYLHRRAVFAGDAKRVCELGMRKADGTPLAIRIESIAFGADHDRESRSALIDLTTIRQAREQLEETERRYRRLAEAVTDYIYSVRVEDGRAADVIHGANCEAVTGYAPEEFQATPGLWTAMVPPEDRPAVDHLVGCVLSSSPATPLEHRIRHKDGRILWVLHTVSPQRNAEGDLVAYDGLLRDITQRMEARKALRTTSIRLNAIFDHAYQFIGLLTPDGRVLECNRAALEATEIARSDVIGRPLWETPWWSHSPDLQRRLRQAIEQAAGGGFDRFEATHPTGSGALIDVDFSLSPIANASGRTDLLVFEGRDITDRKAAEDELRQLNAELEQRVETRTADLRSLTDKLAAKSAELAKQEREFRTLAQNVPALFAYIDRSLRYRYVNRRYEETYRRPSSEIIDRTVAELLGPEAFEVLRPHVDAVLQGEPVSHEAEFDLAEGRRTMHMQYVPDRDEWGEVQGFFALITDITYRKDAEEALRREHQFNENLISTAPNIVLVLDTEGRIVRFNPYMEELTGWQLGEVQGRDWSDVFLPDESLQHVHALADGPLRGGRESGAMSTIVTRDGQKRDIEWCDAPLTDADGHPMGLLCIGLDVTERLVLQRQVMEIAAEEQRRIGQELHDSTQQQLAGLGLLAGSLIEALGRLAQADEQAGLVDRVTRLQERARQVQRGLAQATLQVNRLARGLIPVEVDSQGLASSLTDLARTLDDSEQVTCEFVGDRTIEVADIFAATHLYRIAQEAVNNAMKHSRGDRIELSLSGAGGAVTLKITDNGTGIRRESVDSRAMGLKIMAYRAAAIGATLAVGRASGGGTEVICVAPSRNG